MSLGRLRAAVCLALVLAACATGAPPVHTRSVHGTVVDKRGNPLKGAAVQLENPMTLAVISFNTRNDGQYSFHQLSPDLDFTLTAKYKSWFSKSKVLSKFDSRTEAVIDLEIPVE